MTRTTRLFIGLLGLSWPSGCGDVLAPRPAPLFTVPLAINGESIGEAIIDTGGGYELMLREPFGLAIVGRVEVLAFGGLESVSITEGFQYTVGGWSEEAEAALVGLSVCDCNGVGFGFFRKSGAVLALDFGSLTATFSPYRPLSGAALPFKPPPSALPDFDGAFIEVDIVSGSARTTVLGLLDTGTNSSVMRRTIAFPDASAAPRRTNIFVSHAALGTVAANVGLFDTPGLPDIIIGTDIMRAWSDRWYFYFAEEGGTVTTFPRYDVDDGAPPGGENAGAEDGLPWQASRP